MSKRTVRIAFSALISLAVIAGIYTSVLGASLNAGTSNRRAYVDAGLMPDLKHQRQAEAVQNLQEYMPQTEKSSGHQCDDEGMNPGDY